MSEQHIPIFVGSTFTDLKEYRAKVRDTLTRMETFVHGMEQFGARPGCPVDECLAEVRKCKIYIGIFAMRYGSIPAGYDKSMTELEYDEAQRLGLPSYIFVADEKAVKFSVGDIDFEQQEQLKALKKKLTSKHMVEFFTSPDDLANKVGTAIHRELQENEEEKVVIEKGIENVISAQNDLPGKILWRRFNILPHRWMGVEIKLDVNNFVFDKCRNPKLIELSTPDEFDCKQFNLDYLESVLAKYVICDTTVMVTIVADGENVYPFIDTDYCASLSITGETAGYIEPSSGEYFLVVKVKHVDEIHRAYFENDIPF